MESHKALGDGAESEEASVVAVIGIVAVAVAVVAFAIAFVVAHSSARQNPSQFSLAEHH